MIKTDATALVKQDRTHVQALLADLEGTTERAARHRETFLEEIVKALLAELQGVGVRMGEPVEAMPS